jgi:class 3 adenylate cyclase
VSPKFVSSFDEPDEVIELELMRSELVYLEGLSVSRSVHQPGWRWSLHVRPHVGGDWCQTRHVGVALAGAVHVVLSSGVEFDLRAGTVGDVPPGHDAWVLGDTPYVDLTWTGARTWLPMGDPGAERVLATILFTDIVDSTSIARSLGDQRWADLIATFDARVREALTRHGGREIKTTGDGVLAIFTGAGRAIQCARSLRDLGHTLDLHLRLSLHTGEIDLVGPDIRGIAVNETARILALANPDQILVSSTVKDLVIGSELEWVDRGEHALRGLALTRRLYALVD